jgi:3-dehydroquinate synthase
MWSGKYCCIWKGKSDLTTLKVDLGERSYDIFFGRRLLTEIGRLCRESQLGGRAMVVTNATIGGYYLKPLKESLIKEGFGVSSIEIPEGEEFKNIETLKYIYDSLVSANLDRGSFLVALGGGVIGDITGFAAATYLRGISYIQVPTSLLAQVDSSVGGKTGINHEKGKNLIGAFYQPRMVVIDVSTLDTLPEREFISGLAEVVKYGIVHDRNFFDFIFNNVDKFLDRDKNCLMSAVARSCEIKASVVTKDERESGLRAILNFGHTIGHAIESLTEYKTYLHGEAVSIGMAQAARISEKMGYSVGADTDRIVTLLKKLKLPVDLPSFSAGSYLDAILHDKKVKDGRITFVLNNGIGAYSLANISDLALIMKTCGIGE